MSLFKVTWVNYGELDFTSSDFCKIVYDVSEHQVFYETCNSIGHFLRCDFSSIFDKLHLIVSSEEFQEEIPCEDGCDGDWYKFEYTLNGKEVHYEGYIYGLRWHEYIVSLIESCAKSTLEDERKLLKHECTNNEKESIIKKREELEKDCLSRWVNICTISINVPNTFVRCSCCGSVIHNKYYKNRKYWGRVWLSDAELGDYEVEYDSGECPACGQLNTELPEDIRLRKDDLFCNFDGAPCITAFEEDEDKLYSASELDDLLKHLSEVDRNKIEGCQFKVREDALDNDSGDCCYYITIIKDGCIIGVIDMYYQSNIYFDLIDMEFKTVDTTPHYTYDMVLLDDLLKHIAEVDKDKIDGCQFELFNHTSDYVNGKVCYGITILKAGIEIGKIGMELQSSRYTYKMTLYEESKGTKKPFGDLKFRCEKCGKVFCTCNTFSTSKD